MDKYIIYADGACHGNQNKNANGGYGVVIVTHNDRIELAQGYSNTTNNRMELRAVIAGLEIIRPGCIIDIFTDSQYVCNAFKEKWISKWISNGWKNSSNKPVKNRDLWEELISLSKNHTITWNWIKGHSGHLENERADQLAGMAADSDYLLADIKIN